MGCFVVAWLWANVAFVILGVCIAFVANETGNYVCTNERDAPIAALSDSHNTTGSFFLGAGFIDSQLTYYYFTNVDGAIHSESITADSAYIYEDQEDHPYRAEFQAHIAPGWNSFTLTDGGAICATDFHIPPGSVDKTYKVG